MPSGEYKRTKEAKRKMSEAHRGLKHSKAIKGKISEKAHLKQANHCKLSQEAIEWIGGELLGDGCLYSQSKYSAGFTYGSKHFEYIHYVFDTLKSFGIEQVGRIYKVWKNKTIRNGKWVDRPITLFPKAFYYQSRAYVELKPIYDKWYPKPNRKKIIPKDIKLTTLTCRQWYIGDGCLAHPKNANPYIELCTCGFQVNDVKWLVEKLNNLGFKSTRKTSNNVIRISTYSTEDFLNYIGECPIKCYHYKWDY